jgi:hypothetical protein
VAGIGWWQMFHDTPEDIAERKAHHARMRAASAAVVARTLPRSALAITVNSEDASHQTSLEAGTPPEIASGESPVDAPLGAGSLVPARPPEDAVMLPDEPDAGSDDEMTVYNRYLALLAVRGHAKTWRNPRGL